MTRSIAQDLAALSPPGTTSADSGQRLIDGLAAGMVAEVRQRAASALTDLDAVGPGSQVLAGIRAHFAGAVWELLGPHVRDQARIRRAGQPGLGGIASSDMIAGDAGFVTHMHDGGWASLFERLPRLEVLVSRVAGLEVDAATKLLTRVGRDAGAIGEHFGDGGDPGALVRCALGLSDPHCGRHTVAALTFAGGMHVIYKPRSLAMEAGLSSTLDWLRVQASLDVPAGPAVLERDGYGWSAFVEQCACAGPEEIDLHFRRLGVLTVVLAALAAVDCHADNFVARGPNPVLVDAETLLHPRMLASPGFSLRETEILPGTVSGPAGQQIHYAGFDGPGERESANLPSWDGHAHHLREHRTPFDEGVHAACRILRTRGDRLTGADGPLAAIADRPARVVLRPTSVYGALLSHLVSAPALGRDDGGLDRVEYELGRYRDPVLAPDVWDAVQRAEIAALTRTDVPRFTADTTTGDLRDADGTLLAAGAVTPVLAGLPAVVRQIADAPFSDRTRPG